MRSCLISAHSTLACAGGCVYLLPGHNSNHIRASGEPYTLHARGLHCCLCARGRAKSLFIVSTSTKHSAKHWRKHRWVCLQVSSIAVGYTTSRSSDKFTRGPAFKARTFDTMTPFLDPGFRIRLQLKDVGGAKNGRSPL